MLARNFGNAAICPCCCAFAAGVSAQPVKKDKEFEPQVGQAGKDVVWVPTPQALVDKMLDMAKVTPQDYRHRSRLRRRPHGHHRRQARRHALGIEYNPDMVELSKRNAAKAGVTDKAHVREGGPLRDRFLARRR